MSDKVKCQHYAVDYQKIVREIQETLCIRQNELEDKLQDEKSPIRYIELNAVLNDVRKLRECIYSMFEYCKKPVEVKQDE